MPDYDLIKYEIDKPFARITLNRPISFNSLNLPMLQELHDAIGQVRANPEIRALVIAAAGKAFCGGGDVAAFKEQGDGASAYIRQMTTYLHSCVSRITRMPIPVISAVNGVAAGGGLAFVLAPDLAIAGESARLVMAYTQIGAVADGSSTFFLPRLVGLRRAMELSLLNRSLSAEEALQWGLINRVVPDDQLDDQVDKLAEQLGRGPTWAYGQLKRLLHTSFDHGLETQMENETEAIAGAALTDDFREGTTAFLEKRPPDFQGR